MNPQIFKNNQFGEIRVVQERENIFFIASDVCKSLEIKDTSKAVSRLDADEKGTTLIRTLGGEQNLLTVNEYGLYNLVLSSRKPEAKAFKRWITHEVIPAIRKTGGYTATQPQLFEAQETPLIKYYKGLRVVTKADVQNVLKIRKDRTQELIRKPWLMKEGVDFFLLKGGELFAFRTKYKLPVTKSLLVITASGVQKLYQACNPGISLVKIFPEDKNFVPAPPASPKPTPAPQTVIQPTKEVFAQVQSLKIKLATLGELLNQYVQYNDANTKKALNTIIKNTGARIMSDAANLN